MRKIGGRSMIVFFLLICFTLYGCGLNGTGSNLKNTGSTQSLLSGEADNTEVTITDKPVIIAENIKSDILGNVKFTLDKANSTSAEFGANGKDLALEITDSAGLKWQLVVPDNALIEKQTIKMTALSGIKSDILGPVSGGVMLEPDGLQFLSPATLTVKGPGIKKNGLILTGRNDGSNMDFAYNLPSDNGLTAKILHFSIPVVVNDPVTIEQLQEKALNQCKDAEKAARELLKQPIQVPDPPSISLKCKQGSHDIDETGLEEFVKVFENPEKPIIEALLSAERAYRLVTAQEYDKDYSLTKRVVARLLKKADMLIKTYMPQPEKLYAVSNVTLKATRYYALLDSGNDIDQTKYMKPLSEWAEKAADFYLQELREKHDYMAAHAVMRASRYAALLNGVDSGFYLSELEKALSFKVTFNTSFTGEMSYTLEGSIPLTIKLGEKVFGVGNGDGKYTSFSLPETQLKMPNSFQVNAMVKDFDPCITGTVDILLDRFGAEKETFIVTGIPVTTTGVIQPSMLALFHDMADPSNNPYFKFHTALINGNEVAADEVYNRSMGDNNIKYELKLVHTPK